MSSQDTTPSVQQYFKLIQDPTRREILKAVSDHSRSFSEIRDKLGISGESASKLVYHLQQLETMRLIEKDKENRYETTSFGDRLLLDLQTLEGTIKTLTTTTPWMEILAEQHPIPPTYIVEINGIISVEKEKFNSDMLVARLEEMTRETGIEVNISRYTEKDKTGKIRSGWLVLIPYIRIEEETEEESRNGIAIFDDGSFYVSQCYVDTLRLYSYYDFEKHKKIIAEGRSKIPFFFIQTSAYTLVFMLHICAHTLWTKNLRITLEPPKIKYNWITGKEKEVKITPIWIDDLKEISWKEQVSKEDQEST